MYSVIHCTYVFHLFFAGTRIPLPCLFCLLNATAAVVIHLGFWFIPFSLLPALLIYCLVVCNVSLQNTVSCRTGPR